MPGWAIPHPDFRFPVSCAKRMERLEWQLSDNEFYPLTDGSWPGAARRPVAR